MSKDIEKRQSADIQPARFGGVADVPAGSAPPVITIDKDRCRFDDGSETSAEAMEGHILYMQTYNKYFDHVFDPSNPEPPTCSSSNAIEPDGGTDPQPGPCAACQYNRFVDLDGQGHRGKPCQNRMLVFFYRAGDAIPSVIDLSPPSLNAKLDNGIMKFASRAMNACSAAGTEACYQLARAKLTLQSKSFSRGSTALLNVKVQKVETDQDMLDRLYDFYMMVKNTQIQAAVKEAMSRNEQADEEPPI